MDGDAIDIDFDGTSPTSPHGINVPLNYTEAYASFGVRCVVGNDIPNNAGSLAAITVRAPAGCILNAEFPAAVSARHALGQMLPDVILGCLEQALPGRAPAEGASCIWNPVLRSASGAQGNFRSPAFVINPIFNGGTGARPTQDGLSTTAFPSGVRTTPTEVNEVSAPLIIRRREYLPDTGGSGEYRGGLGQVIEIEHAEARRSSSPRCLTASTTRPRVVAAVTPASPAGSSSGIPTAASTPCAARAATRCRPVQP